MTERTPQSLGELLSLAPVAAVPTDFPVFVREIPSRSSSGRLVLSLHDDAEESVGTARVYSNEWYPGCASRVPWSHYLPILRHCLTGLRLSGSNAPLRLQVLSAVVPPSRGREPEAVLLKFIIAPESAITASVLEDTYGCPLRTFYTGFMGISRDPRRRSGAEWVAGSAIHAGYRGAAGGYVRRDSTEQVSAEYLQGVVDTWIAEYTALIGQESSAPTRLHTRPVAVRDTVLARCAEQWSGEDDVQLLQERLFYSPTRGLLGKADRISRTGAHIRLHEIKTGTSGGERDPSTGRSVPGGLQAAAYFEIMNALGQRPDGVYVEQLGTDDVWVEMPLRDHPVLARARSPRTGHGHPKEVILRDLLAQNRNIAYCLTSGLLTGYDRNLLSGIASPERSRTTAPVDHDLQASSRPCRLCEVNSRGLCEATRDRISAVLPGFFRLLPEPLYAYWVWFHRALQSEEAITRAALYRMVTTPVAELERQEGVAVADLTVMEARGRVVTVGRAARIDTRLREDDRVLLTPQPLLPGEVRSVEGVVTRVGETTLELLLSDPPDTLTSVYRVDRLGYWSAGSWAKQGLTDFMVRSAAESSVAGRQLTLADLPGLARRLLGELRPSAPRLSPVRPAPRLNLEHREAIGSALALAPGELLLVQGPPGTGKTEMIANLVRHVVESRFLKDRALRPILLLANTHRAADEIVLRLHRRFPELRPYIVRVGRPRAGMDPEVAQHLLAEAAQVRERLAAVDLAVDGPATLDRLTREGRLRLEHAEVFVGTLAGARAAELRGLEFEWVVVDEAGQATEPAALQALRHAPDGYTCKLVLVGDQMQLPPVVSDEVAPWLEPPSPELEAMGIRAGDSLKTSMFERLARRWPGAVLTLRRQYRMSASICELVSETYYEGALVPGDEEVAGRSLAETLDDLGGVEMPLGILDPTYRIVFVDTSADPRATERQGGGEESRYNEFEARLVARLVWELSLCVPAATLPRLLATTGVISAYRRQNNLISQELARLLPELGSVRVDTVDRFQGAERDALFVSLVNSGGALGPLHADARRMNVAISRARRKLVVIGNRATFTMADRLEEEAAKERYRRMFEVIDRLAAEGRALLVDSRTLL